MQPFFFRRSVPTLHTWAPEDDRVRPTLLARVRPSPPPPPALDAAGAGEATKSRCGFSSCRAVELTVGLLQALSHDGMEAPPPPPVVAPLAPPLGFAEGRLLALWITCPGGPLRPREGARPYAGKTCMR